MSYRIVKKIVTGRQAIDGAGVHLVRVLGSGTIRDFDPFLMLDAFDSLNPADYVRGFPLHPHRGIETFTYLVKGEIDHKDSLGNSGRIKDGCCPVDDGGRGHPASGNAQGIPPDARAPALDQPAARQKKWSIPNTATSPPTTSPSSRRRA